MKKHVPLDPEPVEEDNVDPWGAWKFFIAVFLILIVIVGFFAYTNYTKKKAQTDNQYNGFDFAQAEGGLWVTRLEIRNQPYDIPFHYHPRELTDIIVDPTAVKPIYAAPREIYISIDPAAGSQPVIAGSEISRITGSKYHIFNIETHGALSAPLEGNLDLPVINCRNATPDRVVVQFVEAKQNLIVRSSNPSCVIINYVNASESIRVADRYTYMLLKVMD